MLGEDAFKKYSSEKGKFVGAVLISGFEVVALGISKNLDFIRTKANEDVKTMIQNIDERPDFKSSVGHGIRPVDRFKRLSTLSLELFKNEN